MSEKFSRYFERDMDKKSAQYTACVAVLLFRELRRDIYDETVQVEDKDVDIKKCRWNDDFYVPRWYFNTKKLNDNNQHCIIPGYKYTGYTGKYTTQIEKDWIKKMCEVAVCEDKSDPNKIHGLIINCGNDYKCYIRSQSLRNSTRRLPA